MRFEASLGCRVNLCWRRRGGGGGEKETREEKEIRGKGKICKGEKKKIGEGEEGDIIISSLTSQK